MMDLVYEPLPAGNYTRILLFDIFGLSTAEFECRFQVVHLDPGAETPPPNYTAMSYCWGNSAPTSRLKFANGQSLPISQTLREMLDSLKEMGLAKDDGPPAGATVTILLWIDAICINQADTHERESQVELMAGIYSSAKTVLAWLGASTPDSRRAFGTDVDVYKDNTKWAADHPIRNDFTLLLARPWFRRTWVVQEISLNQNVSLVCGTDGRPLAWLIHVLILLGYEEYMRTSTYEMFAGLRQKQNVILFVNVRREFLESEEQGVRWESLAWLATSLEATDLRDKVYAFKGIAERGRRMPKPDYDPPCPQTNPSIAVGHDSRTDDSLVEAYNKAVDKVFIDHARAVLCDGCSLDLLIMGGEFEVGRRERLPTWVPDLSRHWPDAWPQTIENRGWNAGGSLVRAALPVAGATHVIRLLARGFDVVDTVCPLFSMGSVAGQLYAMDQLRAMHRRHFANMSDHEWNNILCDALVLGVDHENLFKTHQGTMGHDGIRACFDAWLTRLWATMSEDDLTSLMDEQFVRWMVFTGTISMRWFVTRNGLLGAASPLTAVGDLVFLIPGCRMPLLFRPKWPDRWEKEAKPGTRVGRFLKSLVPACRPGTLEGKAVPCMRLQKPCYLHGAMFGERGNWGFEEWELDVE